MHYTRTFKMIVTAYSTTFISLSTILKVLLLLSLDFLTNNSEKSL